MHIYVPPIWPGEIYSQGFWHAIFAAILYLVGAVMLMVNMLGYALGHYPQKFDLDDSQRTLILQTMMFFFWLAGGAGIMTRIEGWTYANALYWCDVVSGRAFQSIKDLALLLKTLTVSPHHRFWRHIPGQRRRPRLSLHLRARRHHLPRSRHQ
jgi:hypothetical protein